MSLIINGVSEHDLDMAIAIGIHNSRALRDFFLTRSGIESGGHDLDRVEVSVFDSAGETDVLLVVRLPSIGLIGLMIEDKIDANMQPCQAERYHLRGSRGCSQEGWFRFVTMLCAPKLYIDNHRHEAKWGAYLDIESLIEFAEATEGLGFLALICKQAIDRTSTRFRNVSVEASAFWREYLALARTLLPVGTRISGVPERVGLNTPWPKFMVGGRMSARELQHKPQQGVVDLTFPRYSCDQVKQIVRGQLMTDVRVVRTGQSAALRIEVPVVDHLKLFEEQEGRVLAALAAAERLDYLDRRLGELASP